MSSSIGYVSGYSETMESLIEQEIFKLYESGATRTETLEEVGLSETELDRWSSAHNLCWPDQEADLSESLEETPTYWIRIAGEWITLKEAADRRGKEYSVILDRYKRGDRGVHLFRPIRKNNKGVVSEEEGVFVLGISLNQWQEIIDYANNWGMLIAASLYDIPKEAVEAALNGEMERLD